MINDLWSFLLGMIGILVSVMTLIYASLTSKVEELKILRKSTEYTLMNRAIAIENSIESLRKLNKQVVNTLIVAFILFVFSTVLKYYNICWLIFANVAATLLLLVFCLYLAYKIYSQYQKET